MDDSDKTDQNLPLSDGVDDETFARAVGLNNPDPGGTSERKRRTTGVGKRSKAKQERRSKDRTVVRRPPPEVKPVQDSQGSPPEDVTGVVPIIKPAQSATIDVPTSQPVDPQPAQTSHPFRHHIVVGNQHTPIASRKVLLGLEAETTDMP